MMHYTVLWDLDVEEHFIRAWIAADSATRAFLTEIAFWLDSQLAIDPDNKGESRPDLQARIIRVPVTGSTAHVSATYRVLADDRQVRIVRLVFSSG